MVVLSADRAPVFVQALMRSVGARASFTAIAAKEGRMADVKCAKCNVALKGPADPKPQDAFSCPSCGVSDTFENVMFEVKQYAKDRVAQNLNAKLMDVAKNSKFIKITTNSSQHRNYRFIVDMDL
jgi:hypothetical protein